MDHDETTIFGQPLGLTVTPQSMQFYLGKLWAPIDTAESCLAPASKTLETILVVDDNEIVLELVITILKGEGFRVLSAGSGLAALKLAEATTEAIDLLLSDVDMPDLSGPDLGETLKRARPRLRVMLMSGGVSGNLLVLNYGRAYIQKPFVAVKLVQMIREVLHTKNRSQPGGQEFDSRKDPEDRER